MDVQNHDDQTPNNDEKSHVYMSGVKLYLVFRWADTDIMPLNICLLRYGVTTFQCTFDDRLPGQSRPNHSTSFVFTSSSKRLIDRAGDRSLPLFQGLFLSSTHWTWPHGWPQPVGNTLIIKSFLLLTVRRFYDPGWADAQRSSITAYYLE